MYLQVWDLRKFKVPVHVYEDLPNLMSTTSVCYAPDERYVLCAFLYFVILYYTEVLLLFLLFLCLFWTFQMSLYSRLPNAHVDKYAKNKFWNTDTEFTIWKGGIQDSACQNCQTLSAKLELGTLAILFFCCWSTWTHIHCIAWLQRLNLFILVYSLRISSIRLAKLISESRPKRQVLLFESAKFELPLKDTVIIFAPTFLKQVVKWISLLFCRLIITGTSALKDGTGGSLVFIDPVRHEIVRRVAMPQSVVAVKWHPRLNQIFVGTGKAWSFYELLPLICDPWSLATKRFKSDIRTHRMRMTTF